MLHDDLTVNGAGHLCLAGVDTVSLAETWGTPLYVLDEDRIRARMRIYADTMAACFPQGSLPLYASKALCFREIYRIAREEGIGADVVSGGELHTALAAGFPPERLYFHGSSKTEAEIRFAVDAGIGFFIADNPEELRRISRCAAEKGRRQKVLLRLSPGIDPHTFAAVTTGTVESKFGVAIKTGQAVDFVRQALDSPGIELCGYHCHIGSQIADAQPFRDAADIMIDFADRVRALLGCTPPVLNLGGGLAVPYFEGDRSADPAQVIPQIADHLKRRCEEHGLPVPAVLMEPGRSIVADAGLTLYRVENVKSIPGYVDYVAVDGGMTDNPRYALYGAVHSAVAANRASEPADWRVSICGRCCESDDLIGTEMPLQRVQTGDIVAVLVTGAYNYSMASHYNRVPKPAVVMLRGGEARLVVRRETYDDLLSCDL